jgi:hypothetical protein
LLDCLASSTSSSSPRTPASNETMALLLSYASFFYTFYYVVIDLPTTLPAAHGGHKIRRTYSGYNYHWPTILNLNIWLHCQIHASSNTCFAISDVFFVLFHLSAFGSEYSVLESMIPI